MTQDEMISKIEIQEQTIKSLNSQIDMAQEKLDQIGAPKYSAYDNLLTVFGRLDYVMLAPETPPQTNNYNP